MFTQAMNWLPDTSGMTPHGFCLLWQPWLIWLHVLSDVAIAISYFTIPLALIHFVRRRPDMVFRPIVMLFAAFILLCGTTHWLDILTLWVPAYGLQGVVKVLTAAISMLTAINLWHLLPQAISLPSPRQMRLAHAALEVSEARFRASYTSTPLPLHTLDANGAITAVSDRWLDLMGYQRSEVMGRLIHEFVHPEEQQPSRTGFAELLRGVEQRDQDRRLVRKDGVVLDVLLSGRTEQLPNSSDTVILGAVVDVTLRRRAEAALRESEGRFRMLVQSVTDYAIYMLDTGGRVTNWNPGAERIKRYAAAEVVGSHFSRFYTEEDRASGLPTRALETAASQGTYAAEGWRVRRDGSRFWASVLIEAIRDEHGELLGFAKVTRDITERREAQLLLDRTKEQLAQAQKMEAIGQLTGGIAHDFNNMLTAVTGNIELLRKRSRDQADVVRLADNALAACSKAAQLTTQLLSFARRQRLDPVVLDPVVVVRDMHDLLARTASDRISLVVDGEAGSAGLCWADRNQLESALLNLVINARDATPGAGTITISVGAMTMTEAPGGTPTEVLPGRFVRIGVRDTGSGMSDEVRQHAFEPFFTTKEAGRGTGLGLAQIYGFAHQSKGTATIASAPGGGTEVCILLPQTEERLAEDEPEATPEPPVALQDLSERHLLVVEDDQLVRTILRANLEDLGYQVSEAENAAQGMQQLEGGAPFDAVLTDMTMPGDMDGLEFAMAARQRFPKTPVLLTTGHLDILHGRPMPEGIGFVPKPYSRDTLQRALAEALQA